MKKNSSVIVLLFFIVFFVSFSFPNFEGKSLYAYSETLRDLSVTQSISQGKLIFLGPVSSLGNFHFGPAYYYLIYPFVKVTNFALWSLSFASIFYGVLNILLTFFVVKKWWNNSQLALLASGLTSTSTLSIQFAKYGSNPNFIPLFSLLFFYSLERLIVRTQIYKWETFLMALSFGVVIQLHAVPLICLPVILIIMFSRKILKFDTLQWLIFILVVFVTNALYIFYELTHSFENIKSLLDIGTGMNIYSPFLDRVAQYIGFWISPIISLNDFFHIPLILEKQFYFGFIVVLFFLYLIFKYNSVKLQSFLPVLFTSPSVKTVLKYWLIVPSLVLLLPFGALSGLRVYYFFIFSPLVFILFSLCLGKMFFKGYRTTVYYVVAVYLIFQITQMYFYEQLVATFE